MSVLLLSANTGTGHNSAAAAIAEEFIKNGEEATVVDALSYVSPFVSSLISNGHVMIYRYMPKLFNVGWKKAEDVIVDGDPNSRLSKFFALGSEKMWKDIKDGHFDIVISTHAFASSILYSVEKKHPGAFRSAFVETDYMCTPVVKNCPLDYYFIPSEDLIDAFACNTIPREKIYATGIPVREVFYKTEDPVSCREEFGIPANHKHIVVAFGSMGCGNEISLTENLLAVLPDTVEISVIAGTNKKRKEELRKKFENIPNVHIFGYVKDMERLLTITDLYITKPGGLSTTEALQKKVPMLLVNAVGGCEGPNLDFYTSRGLAYTADGEKNLSALAKSLLTDGNKDYLSMCENLESYPKARSAETIYRIMTGKMP